MFGKIQHLGPQFRLDVRQALISSHPRGHELRDGWARPKTVTPRPLRTRNSRLKFPSWGTMEHLEIFNPKPYTVLA